MWKESEIVAYEELGKRKSAGWLTYSEAKAQITNMGFRAYFTVIIKNIGSYSHIFAETVYEPFTVSSLLKNEVILNAILKKNKMLSLILRQMVENNDVSSTIEGLVLSKVF